MDENPNFGIMEGFDEAEGSGNIYRKGQSSDWSLLKIFSSSERERKIFRIDRGTKISRKGQKSRKPTKKLEVSLCIWPGRSVYHISS